MFEHFLGRQQYRITKLKYHFCGQIHVRLSGKIWVEVARAVVEARFSLFSSYESPPLVVVVLAVAAGFFISLDVADFWRPLWSEVFLTMIASDFFFLIQLSAVANLGEPTRWQMPPQKFQNLHIYTLNFSYFLLLNIIF